MSTTIAPTRGALSVSDAAIYCGLSRAGIYKFVMSGQLPSITLGRRRLIRLEALESWLAALEGGPAGADTGSSPASALEGRRAAVNRPLPV